MDKMKHQKTRGQRQREESRVNKEYSLLTKAVCDSLATNTPLPKEYSEYPLAVVEAIAREKIRAEKLAKSSYYWKETPEEFTECEKCGRQAVSSLRGGFYCCHCRHTTKESALTEQVLAYYLQVHASTGLWPLQRDVCVRLKVAPRQLRRILATLRETGRLYRSE